LKKGNNKIRKGNKTKENKKETYKNKNKRIIKIT
jgi:hypothetical protein